MARITLRQLLDHAAERGYGVPAFNMNNMEQALAIMAAADACDAPVILQASRGARAYANDIMLTKMMDAVVEIYPHIPVCVHLDHGNNEATCVTAIQSNFTSVMMDGSLKADGKTRRRLGLQRRASPRRWSTWPIGAACRSRANSACSARSKRAAASRRTATALEGTLSHDQLLTNPDEAVKFVAETKVDALAVAMGTSHGAYKFIAQAGRRRAGHERDRGDPPAAAQHASRDARLLLGARGPAGDHQPLRRQDAADLGRAGRARSSAASSTACARSTSTPTTAWP